MIHVDRFQSDIHNQYYCQHQTSLFQVSGLKGNQIFADFLFVFQCYKSIPETSIAIFGRVSMSQLLLIIPKA